MTRPNLSLLLLAMSLACGSSQTERGALARDDEPPAGSAGGQDSVTGGAAPAAGASSGGTALGGSAGLARGGNDTGSGGNPAGGTPPALGGNAGDPSQSGAAGQGQAGQAQAGSGAGGHGAGAGEAGASGSAGAAGSPATDLCPTPGLRECHDGAPRECSAEQRWVEPAACAPSDECWAGHCSSPLVWLSTPEGDEYGIDRTEVSRAQYAAWLATNPTVTDLPTGCSYTTSFAPDATCEAQVEVCSDTGCEQHPQVCLDWCSAYAYCEAVGKHLCGRVGGGEPEDGLYVTSSEWYNACSSGGVNLYPYGGTYQPLACNSAHLWDSRGNPEPGTVEVGSLASCQSNVPEHRGVFDLAANVWEWVNSCQTYNGVDDLCVMRGGWYENYDAGGHFRCDRAAPTARGTSVRYIGFRCCADN